MKETKRQQKGPSSRKVKWEEMLPGEFMTMLAETPVCLCPYGPAEPHGVYNALGLDWIKAVGICERAALRFGGVLMPPMGWHVLELPGFDWLGSIGVRQAACSALPYDLFLHVLLHQLGAFDRRGFKAVILVTGHAGGNEKDIRLLCDYYRHFSGTPMRISAFADWELMDVDAVKGFPHEVLFKNGPRGDHAGVIETSQLMAIRPDLVDLRLKEDDSATGPWAGQEFPDHNGLQPDRDFGEAMVSSQVKGLGREIEEMLSRFESRTGYTAPGQNLIEEKWDTFSRTTRKYWVPLTFDEYFSPKEGKAEFPGWEKLGL
jgi:creatinine amidohydrolase